MSESTGQELVITEVVARTPVGLNAAQTCASIRAGIARYDEHAYYDTVGADAEWDEPQPLICATLPDIDPFLDYEERLHAVARPLLSTLLAKMDIKRAELSRLGVLLALPEDDPPLQKWRLGQEFLPALLRRSGIANVGVMAANQEGHTGVFSLLRTAAKLLESGRVDHCLVGGLDSYLLEDRMVYRDEAWRLRSERNVDGYIPGEAGALLFVETRARAEARGAKILAALGVQGSGQEPNAYAGERSSSGQGLKQALQAALAGGGEPPNWVVCDLNGESYRHFEWALMETKLPDVMSGLVRTVRPVESIGDVGAASGGILLACVCEAFARGYQPGPEALVWAAADDGKRIAMKVKQSAG
jgi:3-oxoacyl-[acyl-carrier-protein] synthase I